MKYCYLTHIPPELGNLPQLKTLFLYGNDLEYLPPEIGNLSQLHYLFLSKNNLESLPPEIGNLSRLILLFLSKNNLTTLPLQICNLLLPKFWITDNYLHPQNLSDTVIVWLDKTEPGWMNSQNPTGIEGFDSSATSYSFSLSLHRRFIHFSVPSSAAVKLNVYNSQGRLVERVFNSYTSPGPKVIRWRFDAYGSGMYFVKLLMGNRSLTSKAIMLK